MNWTYLIAVILSKDNNIKNFIQTNINIHTHQWSNKINSNQAIKMMAVLIHTINDVIQDNLNDNIIQQAEILDNFLKTDTFHELFYFYYNGIYDIAKKMYQAKWKQININQEIFCSEESRFKQIINNPIIIIDKENTGRNLTYFLQSFSGSIITPGFCKNGDGGKTVEANRMTTIPSRLYLPIHRLQPKVNISYQMNEINRIYATNKVVNYQLVEEVLDEDGVCLLLVCELV
jgi:hypothetical protein